MASREAGPAAPAGLLKPSEALRAPPGAARGAFSGPVDEREATDAGLARLDIEALMEALAAPIGATAEPAAAQADTRVERQGFLVGGVRLLVRFDEASELIEARPVYWLPNVPPIVKGVINLHGVVVPAVDLYEALMGAGRTREARHMLILGHGEARVALLLDSVPEIRRFAPGEAVAPTPPAVLRECARGAYRSAPEEAPWWDMDVQRFLSGLRMIG